MVIALNVLKPLWAGKSKGATPEAEPSEPTSDEEYSLRYMIKRGSPVVMVVLY